ncbi:MAG: aspartyl/asparaginyl beta-hydroxylase domain-containing protein [Acaryochloridaceae cyanobacterium CSU_3_4]|nr:aspartyl/asparaginyl beta-hydroxylase domain-containing protein [Acaryochloridaceae cyanobacterium CSU_3_4]
MSTLSQLHEDWQTKSRQVFLKLAETLLRQLEGLIEYYSLVGNTPFIDPQLFSWVSNLESNWQCIAQELQEVLKYQDELPNFQDLSPDQYRLTQDDRWKTFFFYAFGIKAKQNCDRCPRTSQLLESIPGMKTAFFSILLPHKHIPEHCGVYKGVIRYHLALKVPTPETACRIRVGDQTRHWRLGQGLVFDDRFPHEVWNDSDEVRVVLILDVVRPLPLPISLVNQTIIRLISWSPLVQDAKKLQNKWEHRLGAIMTPSVP